MRPFPTGGGEVALQLLHVGPGVMAGDRLELDVDVGPGAQAVVVAQAAGKLHAMDEPGHATSDVRLRVASGGGLEVHPGLTIPFARSAFRQSVAVELETGARFVWIERWAAGRIATGERHAYRRVSSRVRVAIDGRPAYADALELRPDEAAAPGVFEGRAYLASALAIGHGPADGVAVPPGVWAAAYPFGEAGHAVRAFSDDGVALRRYLVAVSDAWRGAVGRPPLAFDRYGS